MKKIRTILLLLFFIYTQGFSLSVTPSITTLSCGPTNITLTFDCAFNGRVLLTTSPPSGISYSNVTMTNPPLWDVVNGMINLDVNISNVGSAGNWTISFTVISSDLPCAVSSVDTATTSFSYNCINPVNDFCVDAFPLPLGFNTCNYMNFNTVNTTPSGPVASCDPTSFVDLWYSFYSNNTTVTFEYNQNPGIIAFYAIYDNCPIGGGTEVNCGFTTNTSNTPGSFTFTVPNLQTQYYLQLRFNPIENGNDQSFCLHTSTTPSSGPYNIVVSDQGPNMPSMSHQASDIIETSGSATINTLGTLYEAGSCVELNAGFNSTANFEVNMVGCVP